MTATTLLVAVAVTVFVPKNDSVCGLSTMDRRSTVSEKCLSCHDGSAAPPIALHVSGVQGGSHPVGIALASAREQVAIRPGGPLNALLVLPLGRVECVTCHSAQGDGPHWTVMSMGALCTSCHDK